MNTEVDKDKPTLTEQEEERKFDVAALVTLIKKGKKYYSYSFIAIGLILIIAGLQTLAFYRIYTPRITDTNNQLYTLMLEKTRGEQLRNIQTRFQELRTSLRGQDEIASRFENAYEIMGEHFREGPQGTMEQVQSEFEIIQGMIQESLNEEESEELIQASASIDRLSNEFTRLQDIYAVPFDELHASLQSPPAYLWPTATVLRDTSGYLNAVTLNRAIYLSQIGEIGTARVLLSGMYANTQDKELEGLVYYSLGRLQWELFLINQEPENYFQAVDYLRQSMQTDPEASLSKRLFDYMLSLTEAESTPGAGRGDPTTLTEGEAGAVQDPDPLF